MFTNENFSWSQLPTLQNLPNSLRNQTSNDSQSNNDPNTFDPMSTCLVSYKSLLEPSLYLMCSPQTTSFVFWFFIFLIQITHLKPVYDRQWYYQQSKMITLNLLSIWNMPKPQLNTVTFSSGFWAIPNVVYIYKPVTQN